MGCVSSRSGRANRGIEALQMAGLRDAPVLLRHCDQFVGFGNGCRQRLLDQYIDAVLHQTPGDFQMSDSRDGHRRGVHPGCDQFVHRSETPACRIPAQPLGASVIAIRDANKFDVLRRIGRQVAIHASVIAAKGAAANHSYAQCVLIYPFRDCRPSYVAEAKRRCRYCGHS